MSICICKNSCLLFHLIYIEINIFSNVRIKSAIRLFYYVLISVVFLWWNISNCTNCLVIISCNGLVMLVFRFLWHGICRLQWKFHAWAEFESRLRVKCLPLGYNGHRQNGIFIALFKLFVALVRTPVVIQVPPTILTVFWVSLETFKHIKIL